MGAGGLSARGQGPGVIRYREAAAADLRLTMSIETDEKSRKPFRA